ncbi:phage head-tail connector protein [Streptococcus uberis]|nr:phage head-tail connector protein [Streptococcus uberis]
MAILERVKIRMPDVDTQDDALLQELIQSATDRVNLRVGDSALSTKLETVVVEVTVKMYRRLFYEGITSEKADTITTNFVDDILKEYEVDLMNYLAEKIKAETSADKVVRFL